MFLSVIISCHNCKPYIKRVLNSLVLQEFDDMEIIISDDHSTDDFMDEVEKYKGLLDIKYFLTEEHKYHCPGNTRLDGWKHASGDWITFIDHDDEFLPGAFNLVKTQLKANSQYNIPFVFSPVQRIDAVGNVSLLDASTWLHGNFYKRSFLIENEINFKEDLFGNEDLYFNNLVNGTITGKGYSILKLNGPIYKWICNSESLSNKKDGELEYTEKYFGDYLISNSEPHIICYNKFPNQQEYFKRELTQAILYTYFYYQRALYNNGKKKVAQMYTDIVMIYNKILSALNLTTKDMIKDFESDVKRYNDARNIITQLSGSFIESQSISQFLKAL